MYIRDTARGAARYELEEKLAAAGADQTEGVLGTIMEKLRAEGEARGLAAGEALALAKGKSDGLIRLLERRFGPLGQADLDRTAGADLDQLDAWTDRVLDANSMDAAFGKSR